MTHQVPAEFFQVKHGIPQVRRAGILKQCTCKTFETHRLLNYQLHILPEVFSILALRRIFHVYLRKSLYTAERVSDFMGQHRSHLAEHCQTFLLPELFLQPVVTSPGTDEEEGQYPQDNNG